MTNSLADPSAPYREFLSSPPWIKTIQFSRDRNYRLDATDRAHPVRKTGRASYEGALQPNGFFLRHRLGSHIYDNPPGSSQASQDIVPGKEAVSGQSVGSLWRLWPGHETLSVIAPDPQQGGSPNNWLRGSVLRDRDEIRKACRLGLDRLVGGSIVWNDRDNFVWHSPAGTQCFGSITTYTNGLPETLCYGPIPPDPTRYTVRYRYENGRSFPPHEVTVEELKPGSAPLIHRNSIEELQPGMDEKAKEGYAPATFSSPNPAYALITVSSNGLLYRLAENGQLQLVRTAYTPPATGIRRTHKATVICALLLLNLFVIIRCFSKRWKTG